MRKKDERRKKNGSGFTVSQSDSLVLRIIIYGWSSNPRNQEKRGIQTPNPAPHNPCATPVLVRRAAAPNRQCFRTRKWRLGSGDLRLRNDVARELCGTGLLTCAHPFLLVIGCFLRAPSSSGGEVKNLNAKLESKILPCRPRVSSLV